MAGAENVFLLLGGALVVLGIIGTVMPALPGAPVVFVGLLIAAWAEGFQKVGWFTLTILAILTLLSFVVEFLASSLGAKRVGASWAALFCAAAGAIVGLFFGLPGFILGPFVGAVAGEYAARRNWRQASRVGLGTWIGMLLGIAGKLTLVFTMVGIFLTAYVL
ncbi:MAG TPA: DUF456 domain-containing protein [Thermoanaerobaculia bacterium]|jgi:uncharacterized protein YqgC (DUF456 family)|nr:DUF456 domain-containing protein [Thermoanaerobaculia bacterium]